MSDLLRAALPEFLAGLATAAVVAVLRSFRNRWRRPARRPGVGLGVEAEAESGRRTPAATPGPGTRPGGSGRLPQPEQGHRFVDPPELQE
ncbi:hypothetical protein ACFV4F_32580 [Kitasatospora sp. NPDC059722]|uniref:hypothetical protein n=1 Tax=Kitasatospora sp. NPDC059722 TaxID=3346925 RepID=UPI00368E4F21